MRKRHDSGLSHTIEKNSEQFSDLNEQAYDMIACMSKSAELKAIKRKYQKEKGSEIDMCQAITDMITDGETRGIDLAKRVYKSYMEGKSREEIAKECKISLSKVAEILE